LRQGNADTVRTVLAGSPCPRGLAPLTACRWLETLQAGEAAACFHPLPGGLNPMPRKVRELMSDLERAGFVNRGGKGDHRNYQHRKGARVTLSGNPDDDAKPYQEREVRRAIRESQQ
jgi:predicted RNA binding protein YcfA (HicA-like mRNA interferase family)